MMHPGNPLERNAVTSLGINKENGLVSKENDYSYDTICQDSDLLKENNALKVQEKRKML